MAEFVELDDFLKRTSWMLRAAITRCRICHEIKAQTDFRLLKTPKGSWPAYACKPCNRVAQREAYQRRKAEQHDI